MSEEEKTIFENINELDKVLSRKLPSVSYSEEELKKLIVCVYSQPISVVGLMSIIGFLQDEGFNETYAKWLAAYAFCQHFEAFNIVKQIHWFIRKIEVSVIFVSLSLSHDDVKWQIKDVLEQLEISTDESVGEETVTEEQIEATCSTAYFVLIKISKHKNRDAAIEEYARRLAFRDSNVNQTLFIVLVKAIINCENFDAYMKPGQLVPSSLACAGAILCRYISTRDQTTQNYLRIILQGMTADSFATYELMRSVADVTGEDLYKLVDRFTGHHWDKMKDLLRERNQDLNATPCWYMMSPILLPNVRCDFSLSSNPVVALTCIKILKALQPNATTYLDNLKFQSSTSDEEAAERDCRQFVMSRN